MLDLARDGWRVLDALEAHVAVLDATGAVVATNAAWDRFATAEGGVPAGCGVGANYLGVCEAAGGEAASFVRDGLQAVLDGRALRFYHEYECSSPGEQRWFVMQATSLTDDTGRFAVVAHTDITAYRRTVRDATLVVERAESASRELRALARVSPAPPTSTTARSFGLVPLREAAAEEFGVAVQEHREAIARAVAGRVHRVEDDAAERLRALAHRLARLGSSARDVVEIHRQAMAPLVAAGNPGGGLPEEGWVALTGLLGHLLSHYRTWALAAGTAPVTPSPLSADHG